MTIVAAVNAMHRTLVLADCRISYGIDELGRPHIARDVCQKLFTPTPWSVLGFAGYLHVARDVTRDLARRLAQTSFDDPSWLNSDTRVKDLVAWSLREHRRVNGRGRDSESDNDHAQLMIVYLNSAVRLPVDMEPLPTVTVLTVKVPTLEISRSPLGTTIIGSGQQVLPALQANEHDIDFKLVGSLGGPSTGYITSEVLRQLLFEADVQTVGGLHQIFMLGQSGTRPLTYFYWDAVEPRSAAGPGFGTYLAMRVEHGRWVQEHRPTGNIVPLLSPFKIDVAAAPGEHEMFDASQLRRDSPGVLPTPSPALHLFVHYDPPNVPDPVLGSWGNAPLIPLS